MSLRSRLILIACTLLVAAVCVRLGIWQLHRLAQRRAANAAALSARSAPIMLLTRETIATPSIANRRVQASGHYDHSHDLVLRGREYRGAPGVEIVSPLLLGDGTPAVLVNRGFLPSPDAFTVHPDSFQEAGPVTVRGIALPISSGGGAPIAQGSETTWARLDLEALRRQLPYAVQPVYIREFPDSSRRRFPRALDPPALDDGPHLSYAIQWFSFGVLTLVFGILILRQSGKGKAQLRLER